MSPLSFVTRTGVAMVCALTLGSPAAASSVSREVLARPVRAKYPEFRACFDAALDRNPDLKGGEVVTRYVVEKSGAVSSATIVKSEVEDLRMSLCVRRVFMSLDYPEDWPQRTTISYPLVFD